jgi:hypothetical protein
MHQTARRQHKYPNISLHYCPTTILPHCFTASPPHYPTIYTIYLSYSLTASLPLHWPTDLLSHCLLSHWPLALFHCPTIPVPHYRMYWTASLPSKMLPYSFNAQLPHCRLPSNPPVSLLHCLTDVLYHCHPVSPYILLHCPTISPSHWYNGLLPLPPPQSAHCNIAWLAQCKVVPYCLTLPHCDRVIMHHCHCPIVSLNNTVVSNCLTSYCTYLS